MAHLRNIIPLSEFRKRASDLLTALGVSPDPLVITLHGRGVCVVQSLEM